MVDPLEVAERALRRLDEGDFIGAIADWTEAIRLRPHALLYYNRGCTHYQLGSLEEALSDFNEAVRLDSRYADAYGSRGNLRYDMGDLKGAIEDNTMALSLNPRSHIALSNRGEAYLALGQPALALQDFDASLRLDNGFTYAAAARAIALYQLGRTEEAKIQWRRLIEKNPRFRDVEWAGDHLNWNPALRATARKFVAHL